MHIEVRYTEYSHRGLPIFLNSNSQLLIKNIYKREHMTRRYILGLLALLTTALIWGLGVVYQREAMSHIGPFTFNTARFFLGVLSVLPLVWLFSNKNVSKTEKGALLKGGILSGLFLFFGISFQQLGVVETTASKAAFITGLYMIIVPVMGIFLGQRIGAKVWVSGALAFIGLYLLSITDGFNFAPGDGYVLIGAFFWAGQVIVTGIYSPHVDGPKFALLQFIIVLVLSLAVALIFETFSWEQLWAAKEALLFSGVAATGVAMVLQIYAQARVASTQAALIMSLETVFGTLGGWLILSEVLTGRMLTGCTLMLAGILLAQLPGRRNIKPIRWFFRRPKKSKYQL